MSAAGFEREISALRLDLESRDDEVRRLATESLLALPSEVSLPLLVESLGDASWRVRKAAVDQLAGSMHVSEVVQSLIGALSDQTNSGRRNSALEALVSGGADVVGAAIDGLATDDGDVRKQLVDALAGIGDERARTPLMRCLDDDDANVRGSAADALGVIGGAGVPELLEQHAADAAEDPLVRLSALRALVELGVSMPPERLGNATENPVLRPQAYAVLSGCSEASAFEVLLKGLQDRGRSSRAAAIEALIEHVATASPDESPLVARIREAATADPDLIPWVADALESADLSLRLSLVQFLALVGDPRGIVPMVEASCDTAVADVGVSGLLAFGEIATREIDAHWEAFTVPARVVACRVLSGVGGEAAPQRLLSALEVREPELRTAAAAALASLGIESALPTLMRRIDAVGLDVDAESDEERADLTDALRMFATSRPSDPGLAERTLELLVENLANGSEAIRVAVANVIGHAESVGDGALVTRLLKDPSARVRREAVGAVARSESELALESLRLALADEAITVRTAAARELARTGRSSLVDDLARLATDEDPDVRAMALASAGRLASESRDPDTIAKVLELVRATDASNATVAIGAVEALDAIATADAGRLALRFLRREEPDLLQLAISCVGQHADRVVLTELLPLLGHPAWGVRAETVRVLGERGFAPAVTAIMRRQEFEKHEFVRDSILRALRRLEA